MQFFKRCTSLSLTLLLLLMPVYAVGDCFSEGGMEETSTIIENDGAFSGDELYSISNDTYLISDDTELPNFDDLTKEGFSVTSEMAGFYRVIVMEIDLSKFVSIDETKPINLTYYHEGLREDSDYRHISYDNEMDPNDILTSYETDESVKGCTKIAFDIEKIGSTTKIMVKALLFEGGDNLKSYPFKVDFTWTDTAGETHGESKKLTYIFCTSNLDSLKICSMTLGVLIYLSMISKEI